MQPGVFYLCGSRDPVVRGLSSSAARASLATATAATRCTARARSMAKKKDATADDDAGGDAPAEAQVAPSEKKTKKSEKANENYTPKKTHLGDTATIKRLMDDAVVHVFLDKEEGYAYSEDTSMSNLKLFVGFIGVGASLVSHVYPAPFPKNWWVLGLCCAFYFAMSGVLQLLLSFVELESLLVVRGKGKGGGDGGRVPGLNVSSHFPRFQEIYTVGITPVAGSALSMYAAPRFRPDLPGGNTEAGCLQRSWSVESTPPPISASHLRLPSPPTTPPPPPPPPLLSARPVRAQPTPRAHSKPPVRIATAQSSSTRRATSRRTLL